MTILGRQIHVSRRVLGASVWLLALGLFGELARDCRSARARDEIPPPIGEVTKPQGATRSRVVEELRDTRHAEAADGPMCGGEVWDDFEPPTQLGVLLQAPASEREYRQVESAIRACASLRGPVHAVADPFLVLALFRLEREVGAPPGIFAGTYCVEVSMRATPRQGIRFLGDYWNGKPLASGPFQLHEGVWRGVCGGTEEAPHDILWAAGCYWQNVLKAAEKAERLGHCRARDRLHVAEAAASNVGKYGWRCDAKSAHWRVMEAMR